MKAAIVIASAVLGGPLVVIGFFAALLRVAFVVGWVAGIALCSWLSE